MAALKENLPSPWHLTDTGALRTLTKRGQSLKKSEHRRMELHGDLSTLQTDQHHRVECLQWRWQEMKERERKAWQHNRQLLQEFEKAQDTLREMVTCTAAMNTIRMEYERYLEESAPRWQQQLEEKTLSAQRKRMEEYLKERLKRIEDEQVTRCSAEAHPAPSQGITKQPQKAASPQEYYSHSSHPDYNQHDSSCPRIPSIQSSWLTHTHSPLASFPSRMPSHPQASSHVPPSFHPPPVCPQLHPFQPHHLSSTPSHRPAAPQPGSPGWAALQTDYPYSRAAVVAGFPSGRGSGLSQELDIKPVRLSSGHGESSESSRDSSQASQSNKSQERRKRRKEKRGRTACRSSDREEGSSQESSRTSSAVVASASAGQGSESDSSSEIGGSSRRRRSGGLSVKPQSMKQQLRERTRSKGDDSGSQLGESKSQIMENQSPGANSDSCKEEPGSQRDESRSHMEESGSASVKIEDGGAEETEEEQESSSAEQSSAAKSNQGEGHEEETHRNVEQVDEVEENEDSSQSNEEEEDAGAEDDEESLRKNTTEEEEEGEMEEQESECQGEDGGQSDREESESELEGSAPSQDGEMEHDSKGGMEKIEEEEGGGEEGEEQRSYEAGEPEEERDSEDSIVLPQQHRSVKKHSIPEEEATGEEDEEESKREYTDDSSDEFEEDDGIERLLAPQKPETQNKEEKDPKADSKAKAGGEDLDNFSVELDRKTKAAHDTDTDEFDHFYD